LYNNASKGTDDHPGSLAVAPSERMRRPTAAVRVRRTLEAFDVAGTNRLRMADILRKLTCGGQVQGVEFGREIRFRPDLDP
jgi:hypothetical protein